MQRHITHILLITCVLLLISCKTQYSKVSYQAENLMVSENLNTLDNELVQIYLPYKKILDDDMNRIISVSEVEMEKDKPESNLTNFLGDLLLEQGTKIADENGYNLKPDISYFNYGGIRTHIPKGEITVGKIFELMPFENEMVYLQLSGTQIKDFLNILAKNGGDSVGGVRFSISDEKAKNVQIQGSSLIPEKQYWLVTNDYVADGGDDMEILTRHTDFVNSGKKIRDLIISYMEQKREKGEKLFAEKDGRISYE